MLFSDYIDEVRADGFEWINETYDQYDDFEDMYDAMWIEDSITGNGSGSYTFNSYRAKQNVAELIWDDDFLTELKGMGQSIEEVIKNGPEAVDVTARCLALGYSYSEFEKRFAELKEEDD